MPKVDLVCFAHRPHPMQDRLLQSIKALTTGDYEWHLMIHPAGCSANMNRAYHTGSARYVTLLDEDVEIVTPEWIWHLMAIIENQPDVGVVNCAEVKTLKERDDWIQIAGHAPLTNATRDVPWAPAYVTLYDRERTPWLEFDEEIPGRKGMGDLDASMQLRAHGLRRVRHLGVAVYHPHKGDEAQRIADQTTTKQEELDCFKAQHEYMIEKWGQAYMDVTRESYAMFHEYPKVESYHQPDWYKV